MIPGITLENGFSPITIYIEPRSDGGWHGAVMAQRTISPPALPSSLEFGVWYINRLPEGEVWTCSSGDYSPDGMVALADFGRKVRNAMSGSILNGFKAERSD